MEHQKYMPVIVDVLQYDALNTKSSIQRPVSPAPTLRQRRFWHKTGIYALCVLVLGTAALVLALGLITFLWKGVDATAIYNRSTMASLWRTIMTKAWVSRAITLSSLVIRLAIAAQAGVCTSMLAALLLERSGVPVPWVAEVSLIRSATTGPHHLASAVLEAFPHIRSPVVLPVLCAMVFTTLLSQFCSTALLSDLKPGIIVTSTNVSAIPYGRNYNSSFSLPYQGNDYWATRPPNYPAFAEYSEPSTVTDDSFYTGKVYRALLPFSNPLKRSLVHTYSGMATVTYLETACVRPSIQAKLKTGRTAPMLVGTISGSPSAHIIQVNPDFNPINEDFNCQMPIVAQYDTDEPRSHKEWSTGMCRLRGDGNRYHGAFLFLNITKGTYQTFMELNPNRTHDVNSDFTAGVWQYLTSPTARLDLSVSLCWTDSATDHHYVDISSNQSRSEPVLSWTLANANFDSSAIRAQLGALKGADGKQLTNQERNILDLDPNLGREPTGSGRVLNFHRMALEEGDYGNNVTAAMCTYCEINDGHIDTVSFWAHRAQITVFQDILTSTSNPALALQAQYFTLLQMAHYDMQPEMDITSPAAVSFFVEVLMPTGWNGYIAVVVVIAVHLICMVLSVWLFLTRTHFTLLGNTWSAVGQITMSGTASADIASTAAMRTDSEIRRRIQRDTSLFKLDD
ncbi:hypothetical protein FB567DRAFT_617394 [Paraphoma chrysanthemicola]|uniref:Uncharacterized protein n=1 Tax=Paraphoma chrysanthemicola TaxID=798071 RepID=A0A8K0VRR7_9PLEO|nr:hypothetical protein FB567DRAFT_617394 [Paraphoma chrysanthemicola]